MNDFLSMKTIKNSIPNFITCLNLAAGCVACVYGFLGDFQTAAICIILAAIFDFFDGFAARLLKAYSLMGKELDSLADMVSFGLAPAIMLFYLLGQCNMNMAFVAFLLTVFSALRLAKFNIDERQTSSFIGLPVPANAIFWAFLICNIQTSLVLDDKELYISYQIGEMTFSSLQFLLLISALVGIFCYLMISEIPMFSLKFKHSKRKGNELRYVFLAVSLVLLVWFQTKAFPLIILLFIVMSICNNLFFNKKEKLEI
ncbi:MAG: CDP-diacylglycerol--serine O-phosphatidyltransferase [Prevotellaceae bacterium]|jgi:CDP-diacylglycerol--serine O-phosphatidyltransferase|nr:CDP-diacylglycerol--serine O-phosphatidyltransferase [Prevotellaceae bacterium]